DLEIVEPGHAVGLGPHARQARILELIVVSLEENFAVEADLEVVALDAELERMPFPRGNFRIGSRELPAVAVDNLVQADVVLQRIGASDVIIVLVLITGDQAPGLIGLSGN